MSNVSFPQFSTETIFLNGIAHISTFINSAFELFFQALVSLGLPNFSGKFNWKLTPRAEVAKCRNMYNAIRKFYREKIVQAEKHGKDTTDLWKKLEEPFLSLKNFPNLLANFGKVPRNEQKIT